MARKSHAEARKEHKTKTSWLDEYGIKHPGMRQFLLAYVKVGTITGACRALGFGVQKIDNWRKGFNTSHGKQSTPTEEGLRFAEAFEEAKQRHVEALEMELDRRAMKGSDNLLMFRLKGLKPETYRESWRTAGGPNNTPTPSPTTVNLQVNQLIQAGLQDPEKLKQVMELAQKHGLLHQLCGPGELTEGEKAALTKGDLAPAPFKEVIKNQKTADGQEFLPERGEEFLDEPEVIEKEVPRGSSG